METIRERASGRAASAPGTVSGWRSVRGRPRFLVLVVLAAAIGAGGCATTAPVRRPDLAGPEIGMASYYGTKFHGRRTASGERFNRHALTAAHPSLPFGTWVRVTHLASGRSLEVRINDRGPFRKRRIIDVSEAAARKLQFHVAGTARVRVEILDGPTSSTGP